MSGRRTAGQLIQRGPEKFLIRWYTGLNEAKRKVYKAEVVHGSRADAEKRLRQRLHEFDAGLAVQPVKMSVGAYLSEWLGGKPNLAAKTRETYEGFIRLHLIPAMGSIPLQRLSAAHVDRYVRSKSADLSPTTIQHHLRLLHVTLHAAVRRRLIPRNPIDDVEAPRRPHREMQVLDSEQVRLLLAEAKRSSRFALLYRMAILSGMRSGELLGLRWSDVNLTIGQVSVQQAKQATAGAPVFKEPKTKKSQRSIRLASELVEALRLLRDQRPKDVLVFCRADGRPLHKDMVLSDLRRVLKRAGLPHIRFHDLRHTAATLHLQNGTHPKVVQELLGHSTIGVTMDTYSHVLPTMQQEAVNDLERIINGKAAATTR